MSTTHLAQLVGISTAFLASGGIAASSLFDIPMLVSQPASRALPLTRWYFSRGSHVFPPAALLSSSAFAYLAYTTLPGSLSSLLHGGGPASYYAAAALLSLSIAPWTTLVMVPTNFRLIELNERKGGRSSAGQPREATGRSAEESVRNEGGNRAWEDGGSGPQERTEGEVSAEEEEEVRGLLRRFQGLNWVRAGLIGVGGVVGLMGVLVEG